MCSCGGMTQEHTVQENKEVVTRYERCTACGRVCITWEKDACSNSKKGGNL